MAKPQFKLPESTSGDKNVPTTFFVKGQGGFLPGEESENFQKYFCMAELYEASIKDYENVNTDNAEYVVTILIPDPYTDYKPSHKDLFTVDKHMYGDVEFSIENIAPRDERDLKIVGVAYKN